MEQKIEILLVEDDPETRDAFAFCICHNPCFHLNVQTGKQSEGIAVLKEGKIGVVITNNRSDITLECVRDSYPYCSKKKKTQMEVVFHQMDREEEYRRRRIEEYLTSLDFRIGSRVFTYLADAVYYAAYEYCDRDYRIRDIYEAVAEKNHVKWTNVEKNIRDSLERIWTKTRPEILERYYPYPVANESGCPTNQEFIRNAAGNVRSI